MPWFKVDDGLADHPKTIRAGNAAMGLWVRAGAWSAKHLTEGHIPAYMIPVLGSRQQATALVTAGLWLMEDAGFVFHQWNEDGRQPSKESVLAERAASRERQQRAREKARNERHGVTNPVTNGLVTPGVTVPPTRPDPTRPLTKVNEESQGGTTGVEPPHFCSKHPGGTTSRCGPCGDARKVHDSWLAFRKAKPTPIPPRVLAECSVHPGYPPSGCPRCDEEAVAS